MKTTNFFSLVFIIICITLMCSCDTKQHAISQLEKLSKELYLESGNYTEADWQKAKVRFQEIETKIAKHSTEYTEDEKKYIKKTQLECQAYFGKKEIKGLWNELREGIEEGLENILGPSKNDSETEMQN